MIRFELAVRKNGYSHLRRVNETCHLVGITTRMVKLIIEPDGRFGRG